MTSDTSWSFATEASPPQILVAYVEREPVQDVSRRRSCGTRVWTTSRRSTSRCSRPRCSPTSTSSCSATPRSPSQVSTLTNWVNGGGKLVALARTSSSPACSGSPTPERRWQRVPRGRHRRRPERASTADDPVPRHGRPLHAQRSDGDRDALLKRDHGDDEPRGHAPLGRIERRTGGRLHVRPRPLDRLYAPGQSGLGRPGARRRRRHRPDDMFYGAKCGDVQPDWLDTSKIDPAGRRAAAATRQPDHQMEPSKCPCRTSGTCRAARRRPS